MKYMLCTVALTEVKRRISKVFQMRLKFLIYPSYYSFANTEATGLKMLRKMQKTRS